MSLNSSFFLKYSLMWWKTSVNRFLVAFFIFVVALAPGSALSQEANISLLGNALFYTSLGKNNFTGFSVRNFLIRGEGGRGFFYAKGELDTGLSGLLFLSDKIQEDASAIPEFFRTQVPLDQSVVRIRELFVSTRGLPFVRLTIGRIFGRIGDANSEDFWKRNFVERAFTIRYFFGLDGFIDEGFELSFSPPLPWTLDIVGQVFDGSEKSWDSKGSADLVGLVSIRNVFGDDRTNGGFSLFWSFGRNSTSQRLSLKKTAIVSENDSEFFGGDAFSNFNPFFSVRIGYIIGRSEKPAILDIEGGLYTEFSVRPVEFFRTNIRPEIFGLPWTRDEAGFVTSRPQIVELSISFDFIPENFIKVRIQWTGNFGEKRLPQNIFYFQTIFNVEED